MKCVVCGKAVRIVTASKQFRIKGIHLDKKVRVGKCPKCGKEYRVC